MYISLALYVILTIFGCPKPLNCNFGPLCVLIRIVYEDKMLDAKKFNVSIAIQKRNNDDLYTVKTKNVCLKMCP